MVELIVIFWWGAYIGALAIQKDNTSKSWAMLLLGYMSIGFAFLFAETTLSYVLSAIVLAAVHFLFGRLSTTIFALLLIFLGYVIKFS